MSDKIFDHATTIDTGSDAAAQARAMSPVDFASLGLGAIAYVRPIQLPDGSQGLRINDAMGRPLAVAASVVAAMEMAEAADLALINLQ